MFGSRVGFSGTADRTASFPVGSNPFGSPHYPILCVTMNTAYTLPSDSIMTVDAYDRRLDTYFVRRVTSRRIKRKNEKADVEK